MNLGIKQVLDKRGAVILLLIGATVIGYAGYSLGYDKGQSKAVTYNLNLNENDLDECQADLEETENRINRYRESLSAANNEIDTANRQMVLARSEIEQGSCQAAYRELLKYQVHIVEEPK